MDRSVEKYDWRRTALTFTLAGAVSAMFTGGILGVVGGSIPESARQQTATGLALIGVAIAIVELVRRRPVWLPQRSRETPKRWLARSAAIWALLNGAALGVGATSRIGFWLWYVVPLSALLSGSVVFGAAIYGAYGLVRASGVWVLLLAPETRRRGLDFVALRLVRRIPDARLVARVQLLAVCALVAITQ
ncbi:MAG: hypothetical protein ACRDNB_07535 [Gaiellaceae bacterium]